MRNITIHLIENRIKSAEKGRIFVPSDFSDIASDDAIRKSLSRFTRAGILDRVYRGIYRKPNFNAFLNREIPATPDELAEAIARSKHWTIGPEGERALNQLGLSTQVPANYRYISDGPTKSLIYEGIEVKFIHRSSRSLCGNTRKTIMIMESLRTIGRERIDLSIRRMIYNKCTENELVDLLRASKTATSWLRTEINSILALKEFAG